MTSIALASEATIRKRVFARFAWDQNTASKLSYQVATFRTAGYDARLREYAKQLDVSHPAQLTDSSRLDAITLDSRGVSIGVTRTYNADLRRFLDAQPTGLSQRELAKRTSEWQQSRADWKVPQIAKTELMSGRALAEKDVMSLNNFVVLQRASPRTAQCPLCTALVARGWLRPDQLNEQPPLHPGCVHSWEADSRIKDQAEARGRLWLGSWKAQ